MKEGPALFQRALQAIEISRGQREGGRGEIYTHVWKACDSQVASELAKTDEAELEENTNHKG